TPEEVDTPHQASGSPAIQGYGVVLNMKLWGAVFVIWYLITAVLFLLLYGLRVIAISLLDKVDTE
ncbi:MAG: hypothetical protein DSY42_07905, partial [Aquifex sp.]